MVVVNGHGKETLPPFCIAAVTFSSQPVRDPTMHGSQLVLIWFTVVLPLGAEVLGVSELQSFAWEAFAEDFRW